MIREAVQEDRASFLAMAEEFYSSKAVAHNIDSRLIEATFDAALSKPHLVRVFIIENGMTPAGFAIVSFSYATEVGGLVVILEDLYIGNSCRGMGLGSEFMLFLEQEYQTAKRFRLEVRKENVKAIELYSRLGYSLLEYVQMVKDIDF